MMAIDEIIALIIFTVFGLMVILCPILHCELHPVLADVVKTMVGFIFGKKYGQVREVIKNGN